MDPYRTQSLRRPTHAVGEHRAQWMKVLGAAGLVALQLALLVVSASSSVSVVWFAPMAFAGLLVTQARMATIELHPEERVGMIVIRRLGLAKRTSFAYAELGKTEVVRAIFLGSPADYELRLALSSNRTIPLLRGSQTELAEHRGKLDVFLDENGLPERKQ